MTKQIIGSKLSRQEKVKSYSFSGAKVEDLSDYVKPILRRNPKEVIIHVGTNNLRPNNPDTILRRKLLTLQVRLKKTAHKPKLLYLL